MNEYGHDEAKRDLELARVGDYGGYCRLTAYIERLELAYKNCRDCEVFTAYKCPRCGKGVNDE